MVMAKVNGQWAMKSVGNGQWASNGQWAMGVNGNGQWSGHGGQWAMGIGMGNKFRRGRALI